MYTKRQQPLEFLEQARNESMARRELTIQSHALLVVRTMDSIYSALQRNPFNGVELDALAAIMHLFDAMLYYADRERQPGMTRKEAELCLVEHLNEAYPGQEACDGRQSA
ncbi:hypothetical protein [Photorhabdus khanii]|uniref:hypothetical protein n=1 Tax=Photorhabdus khanii TaxID=1004150 RepID=UPI001EF0C529|nr:hypothetical protein [Photorhabdus khanii]